MSSANISDKIRVKCPKCGEYYWIDRDGVVPQGHNGCEGEC